MDLCWVLVLAVLRLILLVAPCLNCLEAVKKPTPVAFKVMCLLFFFQAEDGIRDYKVTGVQTCALPISARPWPSSTRGRQCASLCIRAFCAATLVTPLPQV